jgi:hypothetical protein
MGREMNRTEKANLILNSLDEYINVNWSMEEFYIKAINKALLEIEKVEAPVTVVKVNKNDIPTKIIFNGHEYAVLPESLGKRRG